MRNRVILLAVLVNCLIFGNAKEYKGGITYNSYEGLVMAGYQGWFNTPGDGAGRGWHHYEGHNGFKPGSATDDLWPDVSEYKKLYKSPMKFADGTFAYLPSPYDSSTVDTHFRWMKEYGLDGVFMQRFVAEIRNASGLNHFNRVLNNAMAAANKYDRAISVMYDLSGMEPGEEQIVLSDVQKVAKEYSLFKHSVNPSYLYHNGKPLISVWGIGFNDHRKYGLKECKTIIDGLKKLGFSVMIGVPTHWRDLDNDTESDPELLSLIKECDIVMPWFVGRYDEKTYADYHELINKDIEWAKENGVDYAPLCYAGFSWHNMHYPHIPPVEIPRNKGKFFKMQLDYCINAGAKMLYIAMFDEIDEGTAIFKIARKVPAPVPGSVYVPLEDGIGSDHYLKMVGEAAKELRAKLNIKTNEN